MITCVFFSIVDVKSFQFKLKELQQGLSSVFTDRTDEASAVQYFQVEKLNKIAFQFIINNIAENQFMFKFMSLLGDRLGKADR